MRTLFLGLCCLLLLQACQREKRALQGQIAELEARMAEQPDDSVMRPLLTYYQRYAKAYPEDALAPVYLYRTAEIYFRVNNYEQTSIHLESILRDFPKAEIIPQTLIFGGMLYDERMAAPKRAEELYQRYLDEFPDGPDKEKAAFFFKPEIERLHARIEQARTKLQGANRGEINQEVGLQLVGFYRYLVEKYSQDPKTPAYCYEGAVLAKNMGRLEDAVMMLKQYVEQYEKEPQHADALFVLATTYENEMEEYKRYYEQEENKRVRTDVSRKFRPMPGGELDYKKEAEKLYKLFLQRYPNHALKPLVEQSLKFIHKDPSDLVEQFAKQHKEKKK